MHVRLGLAHYWREVTVLFCSKDMQPAERLMVFTEGWHIHDLLSVGGNRFLLLCDGHVAGRDWVTLEQWDCDSWTCRLMLLPKDVVWGAITVSPDGQSYAVSAYLQRRAHYVLHGQWGQQARFVKFASQNETDFSISDMDDAGNVTLSRSNADDTLSLYRLSNHTPTAQHFGRVDAADFPSLCQKPFLMPDAAERGVQARGSLLARRDLPQSSTASGMKSIALPEKIAPRLTAALVQGKLVDPI